jgi:hypothetical protein
MTGPFTRRPDDDPTNVLAWRAGRDAGRTVPISPPAATPGPPHRDPRLPTTLLRLRRGRFPRKIHGRKDYSKRTTRPIPLNPRPLLSRPNPRRLRIAGIVGSRCPPCDRPGRNIATDTAQRRLGRRGRHFCRFTIGTRWGSRLSRPPRNAVWGTPEGRAANLSSGKSVWRALARRQGCV